jgi:hypothetical protein
MRLKFLSKLSIPKEQLRGKRISVSFSRDSGQTIETGIGKIMITGPNPEGFYEVSVQLLDLVRSKWVRLYLSQASVDAIVSSECETFDFECRKMLTDVLDMKG